MKKTKSLVITSLLFSAMTLNAATIQNVVQAADGGQEAVVPETPKPETPKPETPKPSTPVATDKKTYKTTINFIDQATKKKIESTSVSGKDGEKVSFKLPKGYKLVKGTSNITIDKNKKSVEIVVKSTTESKITAFKGKISTKKQAVLYSKDGKKIANRGLGVNSDWASDKKMTLNGETYYGVSTNEFVKASDVFEYETLNTTIGTSAGTAKHLYTSDGKMVSNRALASNTSWRTDKKTKINGKDAYRVSTNEWVFASDIK